MCEAFQAQGAHVELIVPFRFQSAAMKQVKNIWQHYDVTTPFTLIHLPAPDFIPLERIFPPKIILGLYYLQSVLFSLMALLFTLFRSKDVYYSRDWQTLLLLCLTRRIHRTPIFFEAHELHGDPTSNEWRSRLVRWVLRRLDGVIVITHTLKTLYREMGVPEQKLLVAFDGVDEKRFFTKHAQAETRASLNIPLDKKMICYTGHLFQWKGVYTLAESSAYLPEDCRIYIIGGMEPDIQQMRRFMTARSLNKVFLTGYVSYRTIGAYLAAADVLVLPNSGKARIAREYTSPLKLFEYMGAKKPIVASDLPSLREVLRHRHNAYLVQPDQPEALAEGIKAVLNDEILSQKITRQAYEDVQAYTWNIRAHRILQFFSTIGEALKI